MVFKKGRDRFVVVFPSLGIAIKFPIIRLLLTVQTIGDQIKGGHWRWLVRLSQFSVEQHFSLRGMLFKGLFANWGEFWFYWQTRNPFLQPTYFSLFGFLNIQQSDEPCLLKHVDLWCQLYELTEGKVFDESHHFHDPKNFCFHNGTLRMLDYGSPKSRGVIALYGAKIVERFDPTYCWEEEKKKIGAT